VINTNDVITFYGSSVAELRDEMMKSLEEYFQFCQEHHRKPKEPFSGRMMIQTSPELHRLVALEAARHRINMNSYIQEILKKAVATES
jgi:predicted HicB family RNase H-like nuclease